MQMRWHQKSAEYRETPLIDAFVAAIAEVCKKHGFSIGHEDYQGAFLIRTFSQDDIEWLQGATDETE